MIQVFNGNTVIYSDVDSNAPKTNRLLYNLDAVHQSVENILFCKRLEMPFLRDFGSNLEDLLFEPMDQFTANNIYVQVISSIERWDDRVIINKSRSWVRPNYDNHAYDVQLVYKVKNFEDQWYSIRGSLAERRTELIDR